MRSEFAVLIAVGFSAFALGAAYLVTQDGVLSESNHAWRVEIVPKGPGPWSVEVPRLVATVNATDDQRASLDLLLDGLHLESGEAQLQLQSSHLRLVGRGNATIAATRTLERGAEDFLEWESSGREVSRADDATGPVLRVTWSVALSAGDGRVCSVTASHGVDAAPGDRREFPVPLGLASADTSKDAPKVPMWKPVCP